MPALVQSVSKFQFNNVSGSIGVSLNNTAGNVLVAVYHPQQAAGTQTFADSLGNVWQTLSKFNDPNTGQLTWFLYVPNCKGGANVVTGTTQSAIPVGASLVVYEISGLGPLDKASAPGAASTSGSPAPLSTPSVTTGVPNAFAFAVFSGDKGGASASNTYTPGAGWTQGYYAAGEVNTSTLAFCSFFAEFQSVPNMGTVVQGTATTQAGYEVDSLLVTFGAAAAAGPRLLLSTGVGI